MSKNLSHLFRNLQIFATVAEFKNYAKAAAKLEINVSSISRHIKMLEERLCHPLVIKDGRSMRVTEEGQSLYEGFIHQEHALHEILMQFCIRPDYLNNNAISSQMIKPMFKLDDGVFHDLQIFSAVAATGNYTSAAQKLEINISNIGRRIKALEEQLNCNLIIRNGRQIIITESGLNLFQLFIQYEKKLSALLDKFQTALNLEIGEINIIIPNGIIEYILSSKIAHYLQQHPNIAINLICHNREINLIAEKYDCAILRHIPKQNSLKIRKLYDMKIQLYCTKEYKQRYGIPETLNEINQHMVLGRIQDDANKITQYHVTNGTDSTFLYIHSRFSTNNTAIDKQIVMNNEVIAGGNDYLYQDELANGKIIKVLPEYYFETGFQSFYIVSDNNKYRRKIVKDFMNFIIDTFAQIS